MIIYGSKPAHLKTVELTSATCPNCNTQGSLALSAYSKHAHIYWIPLFPVGKLGVCECERCDYVVDQTEMPENISWAYNNLKGETKTPIWQFSGLGIIAILIGLFIIWDKQETKKELEYLVAPAIKDVYEYKTESGNYSTMKVVKILEDTIYLSLNEYEINKKSGITEIEVKKNYSDFHIGLTKADLKKMYQNYLMQLGIVCLTSISWNSTPL